jgi:uncharacterized protein YjbI with pentapeptide repeats
MANPKHIEILKQGAGVWNKWISTHPRNQTDLSNADLSYVNFRHVILNNTDLRYANLSNADLSGSVIYGVNLNNANLSAADLTNCALGGTTFGDVDLSETKGLESVRHIYPSTIGIDTIYKSRGEIPEVFLRGCGVPDEFITYMRSLTVQPIQFYSCFISYSNKDEEFARRLYSRMRDEHLRVWFAPEDIKGGQKLHEQIERAIQVHDRLLLILSEHSMQSDWVMTEVLRARKTEMEEKRRKLFPITIVDFERIKSWSRFDADSGKDLAKEVREYFIPDFSNWKDHDDFENAFERLLRDLKAEERS